MKEIYKYMTFVIVGLLLMPMAGCSDDDDSPDGNNSFDYSIVGEWYTETGKSVNGIKEQGISQYNSDGTWHGSVVYIDALHNQNVSIDGTYRITGKTFIQTMNMFGETSTSTYNIQSLGKYDLMMYFPEGEMIDLSHRIVDTVHMQVGQSDNVQINDPDFMPMEYSSSDEDVVDIAATGTFQTKRAGTAYLSVVSSIGTAVIRVVVTDPETYIDNFVRYLGEERSTVTNAYGNLYYDIDLGNGVINQQYALIDDNINEVTFCYSANRVDSIDLWLNETADIDNILTAFSNHYSYLTDYNGVYYFRTMKNLRVVRIHYVDEYKGIRIKFNDPNDPFIDLDNLVRMTATEAANTLGHVITEEEREDGKFIHVLGKYENAVFSGLSIRFDEYDEIHQLTLYCKEGTSQSDIEFWYQQNYIYISEGSYGQMTPLMLISLDEDEDGNTHVIYTK